MPTRVAIASEVPMPDRVNDDFAELVANMPADAEFQPVPVFASAVVPESIPPRRLLRAVLGEAAVVSVTEAAEWLPLGDRRARAWLRDAGLVRTIDGKAVVRWRDVLRALEDRPAQDRHTRRKRSIEGVDIDEVEGWLAS